MSNAHPDGAVHAPVSHSVLFDFPDAQGIVDAFQGKRMAHVYGRSSSPTASALQAVLTQQHQALGCVTFASGMAAISSFMLAFLKQGDHVIVSQFLFGNTRSFFQQISEFGVAVSFVDPTSLDAVQNAQQPNTRLLFTEGLANPLTQVPDMHALGSWAKAQGVMSMVDITMTPHVMADFATLPIDILVTSLTKYVAGHGQALGGAVLDMGKFDWTSYPHIDPRYQVTDTAQWGLTQLRKKGLRDIGATLSPEAASSILIGQETLAMRFATIQENTSQIARCLAQHTLVEHVYHPSLPTHPQHQLVSEQYNGTGGIVSFTLSESIDPVLFINQLQLIICATHLGDTRTLALPVTQTIFFEFTQEEKDAMGVNEKLIRLSVGIEHVDDLCADLIQALNYFSA
jgi:O-acetylhomoserine (thiol)-lyase